MSSTVRQSQYATWGMQIAQVCMYVHTHGALPGLKTSKGLKLGSARTRAKLVRALSTFILTHELSGRRPSEKLETIVAATEGALKNKLSDADDGALLLATIINMSDVIAHDQRTLYPNDPPMRDMVVNLGAMLTPVASKALGDTLPEDVRQAWPDFAGLLSV